MATTTVHVPDELLALLRQSRLAGRPLPKQVRVALAIQLFQEHLVSLGKAAELGGEPLATFQLLLADLGVPAIPYDEQDLNDDLRHLATARGEHTTD